MMNTFHLTKPSKQDVLDTLEGCLTRPFSYPFVGASKTGAPNGWRSDDQRILLGDSKQFEAARRALHGWIQFDLTWVFPHEQDVPIEKGNLFCFTSRQFGIWAINVCRIVYLIDEDSDSARRYGFAYGTVDRHSVAGEETFTLELDKRTNQLFFRLTKFSRPAHFLTRIALPLTHYVQNCFTRDALNRFKQEVQA